MNKSPQYNQQTDRQVISSESLKLRKYVGIYQTWKVVAIAQHPYLKINIVIPMLERIPSNNI